MLTRQLKLKLTKKQENQLNDWLLSCSSIYNFGIRKIEQNAQDKVYFTKFDFMSLLAGHSKKLDIPSHTMNGILLQAFLAWQRCFKKVSKKPKLKGIRNKLRSIPFPDPIKTPENNKVIIPLLGKIRYFKQDLPIGKIKNGRIIKRASGWYLQLTIDAKHTFKVKETNEKVGIDTGFKHLAVLSNGTKYENQRNFVKNQKRLAQAQRGRNKKLAAKLHEKITNQRKDYNHKISKEIVENYQEIYITNDNLRNQSKIFGKSVMDAGISQLREFLIYKGDNHGRKVSLVDSKYTTMTCSSCLARSGPTGLSGLDVRNWECSVCGADHDRDINSAMVILDSGLGYSLVNLKWAGNAY